MPMDHIEFSEYFATIKDEGGNEKRRVLLADLLLELEKTEQPSDCASTPMMPFGTKAYFKNGQREVVVIEQEPQIRTIRNGAGERFTVALPYVVYLLFFERNYMTSYKSRLFYRTAPITSLDDELLLCNLTHINVQRNDGNYRVGSVCMRASHDSSDPLIKKITANMEYYWNSTFTEYADGGTYFDGFRKMKKVDSRVASFGEWQKASAENPAFVLEAPWIESKLSIRSIIEDMLGQKDEEAEAEPKPREIINQATQLADVIYRLPEAA